MNATTMDENPYSAPDADLQQGQTELYEPKVFSFSGRIGRLRYLAYYMGMYLLAMAAMIPLGAIGMVAGATDNPSAIAMVTTGVLYIVLVVAGVAFAKRRFNDLNRSGWWVLTFVVPIVNLLATIYVLFFPGTDGDNDFGPAPTANPLGVKILALSMPVIALIGILAAVLIPMFAS